MGGYNGRRAARDSRRVRERAHPMKDLSPDGTKTSLESQIVAGSFICVRYKSYNANRTVLTVQNWPKSTDGIVFGES